MYNQATGLTLLPFLQKNGQPEAAFEDGTISFYSQEAGELNLVLKIFRQSGELIREFFYSIVFNASQAETEQTVSPFETGESSIALNQFGDLQMTESNTELSVVPPSEYFEINFETQSLEINQAGLLQNSEGGTSYEIVIGVSDGSSTQKEVFNIVVPIMTDEEIAEFFAGFVQNTISPGNELPGFDSASVS
jgi:hypothetical protein